MMQPVGIHHITALSGDPQATLDFYAGVLGLRLTKRTVNHDDPGTYHLYFSNQAAEVGTHLTFFPQSNAPRGKRGGGQVGDVVFAVPPRSMAFWKRRLIEHGTKYHVEQRLGESVLWFKDSFGLSLGIVERDVEGGNAWDGIVESQYAITGIAFATLLSMFPDHSKQHLKRTFGFKLEDSDAAFYRLNGTVETGGELHLSRTVHGRGIEGAGTVHHIAFRAANDDHQREILHALDGQNYRTTQIIDRTYFRSVYYRECGFILFEVATDGPGFTVDEAFDQLGAKLTLPAHLEKKRQRIQSALRSLEIQKGYLEKPSQP